MQAALTTTTLTATTTGHNNNNNCLLRAVEELRAIRTHIFASVFVAHRGVVGEQEGVGGWGVRYEATVRGANESLPPSGTLLLPSGVSRVHTLFRQSINI